MGKIGHGYGSEWHLMRYLGRHRHQLDEAVCKATGAQSVCWLDFPFGGPETKYLAEHKGLDFLFGPPGCPSGNDRPGLRARWTEFWPQSGNSMNWDAVGWLRNGTQMGLLLVEAKCHEGELFSECGAKSNRSREQIRRALDEAKRAFGARESPCWKKPCYQYCNRLAVLHFLHENDIPARLLFIYFTGDAMKDRNCPGSEAEWEPILDRMYGHIGLTWIQQQAKGVHKLFLPVSGGGATPKLL